MKEYIAIFCFSLALSTNTVAASPSDSSLSQLMAITNMKQILNGTYAQVDDMMNGMIQQSLRGKKVTQAQQNAIDNMKIRMSSLFKKEYTWERLEPKFRSVYKESFTQEEVDGMITFYRTPSGQAVIKKMPLVMQNTMAAVQSIIQDLLPQMQEIQQEFLAELKDASRE